MVALLKSPSLHLNLSRAARLAVLLLGSALTLALVQQLFSFGFTKTLSIDPARHKLFPDGKAFRYRLPDDFRGALVAAKGVVTEDGKPLLNRREISRDVVADGGGSYAFKSPQVRFAASDDSDVRTNGRHYAVVVPYQFDDDVFYWLVGLLLLALTGQVALEQRSFAPLELVSSHQLFRVWNLDGVVFFIALVAMVSHVFLHPELSSGGLLVKGMPDSDAGGWHEMAEGFADGRGITTAWEAQRPFYSIFLGAIYMVCGHSVLVPKLVHAVIIALTAALLTGFGRALRHPWAGLAAGAAVVGSAQHALIMHSILTENVGLLYSTTGVLALWRTVFPQRENERAWQRALRAFVAGWLVALGNLGSGVLLLLVPIAPLLLVAMVWQRRGVGLLASAKRPLLIASAFTLGVCLVFVPWMARQQAHYGVFTLSTNTGELLYGGADPVNGKLVGANFHLPANAGLDPNDLGLRMRFFMAKYKAQVASNPLGYLRQVGRAWWRVFAVSPLDTEACRTAVLLLILGTGLALTLRKRNLLPFLLAGGLAGGWLGMEPDATLPVGLLALALCLWRARSTAERWLLGLLVATLVSGTFLSALAGTVGIGRFWTVIDWALLLLVCVGTAHLVTVFSEGGLWVWNRVRKQEILIDLSSDYGPSPERWLPRWHFLTHCLAALSLLMLVMVVLRTLIGPTPISPSFSDLKDSSELAHWAINQHPNAALHQRIADCTTTLAQYEGRGIYFAAGEDIGTFQPDFQMRRYPRWVLMPTVLSSSGLRTQAIPMQCMEDPREWPALTSPALWIAVTSAGTNRISGESPPLREVIAIIPLVRSAGGLCWEADRAATRWMPPGN